MKANELRIGNYVNFGIVDEPIEITGGIDDSNSTIIMANPIPLTAEWLVKFGFEKERWDLMEEDMYVKKYNFHENSISIGGESFNFYNGIFTQSLKTVHQLQNLYFALVGEELTLKTKQP